MAVPNIFANATTSIPLSQLDQNFATAITLGNTAVYLGNTTTTIGNVTLTNVTISSGNSTVTKETVTTITSPASTALTIQSNSVTAITIDTSQNVGFGTASPTFKTQINSNGNQLLVDNSGGGQFTNINIASAGVNKANWYWDQVNTYMVFGTDVSAPVLFKTNAAERMRIDSSGNVGIGTSSPSYKLDVRGGNLRIAANASGASDAVLYFGNAATNYIFGGDGSNYMTFGTNGSERARIDTSGFLTVGSSTYTKAPLTVQTAPSSSAYGQIAAFSTGSGDVGNAGISVTKYDNNTTTSQVFARFLVNQGTTASGQINANGASAAAFGTYSDERLKENINDLPSQIASITALRPVEFDYIESEGGGRQIGFIAQEMKEIYPDVVGEREDGMFTITGWSKTEARLVKAIQEQQAMIEQLKADVAALKGAK